MRGWLLAGIIAAQICGAATAQGYRPDFDPGRYKGPRTGQQNEIAVLGSPHLSELPKDLDPATLNPLIERLAAWRPQMIAIEAVSGAQCDFLRRYPDRYADTVKSYCWDTAPARAAVGLDVPAAIAAADRLLAEWPSEPTAAQRRRLSALFLAGGESASALVQWLRLSEAERHAGDGLDATLVERLETLRTRRNEIYLIAAPLAARLGHERLFTMDDHTADSAVADEKANGAAMSAAWDNPATRQRRRVGDALAKGAGSGDGVLAMYRAYNARGQAKLAFDSDFGAALNEPSPQRFGRGYVGYWETRNLRMAGNIRDVLARRPGSRALVIVGASHKAYLDAYLNMMHDARIVDTGRMLR